MRSRCCCARKLYTVSDSWGLAWSCWQDQGARVLYSRSTGQRLLQHCTQPAQLLALCRCGGPVILGESTTVGPHLWYWLLVCVSISCLTTLIYCISQR
jgi:hypothetical protein